jgi:hypothetical protein
MHHMHSVLTHTISNLNKVPYKCLCCMNSSSEAVGCL